jgi:hypothetical protein
VANTATSRESIFSADECSATYGTLAWYGMVIYKYTIPYISSEAIAHTRVDEAGGAAHAVQQGAVVKSMDINE